MGDGRATRSPSAGMREAKRRSLNQMTGVDAIGDAAHDAAAERAPFGGVHQRPGHARERCTVEQQRHISEGLAFVKSNLAAALPILVEDS